VVIFVLLPAFDVMRFDIVRQRFYFFGAELWISEFSIIFLSLMFLWILVAAMAMIYGRFYCGYLCPQMIFSETAATLEKSIARRMARRLADLSPVLRRSIAKAAFYLVLLPASIFVTFVFVSYFVPPLDLFHRLMSLDIRTAGGIVGASVTLITFLDFALVRTRFCTAICPYGYLQTMLADKHTLLVHFQDSEGNCIHCDKCVRACPMGIDIRSGPHQLECTHCAECVDACSDIVGKLGRKTLIRYAWGDAGEAALTAVPAASKPAWYRRIGFRDGKRIAILVLLTVYAIGLSIAISLRQPVLVRIMPNRITLYTMGTDGSIHNRFRLLASNRSHAKATLDLSISGLPAARIVDLNRDIVLEPGESLQREFEVAAPASAVAPGVNHMQIRATVVPAQKSGLLDETFIAPMESTAPQKAPEGRQR